MDTKKVSKNKMRKYFANCAAELSQDTEWDPKKNQIQYEFTCKGYEKSHFKGSE